MKGVAQRDKEERWMKEQHEGLVEDKKRLKDELDEATLCFAQIQARIQKFNVRRDL